MLRRLWQTLRNALPGRPAAIPTKPTDIIRFPPHPANVPGPFYVEDGCCVACAVWEEVASDLLAWTEDEGEHGTYPHCYVARQPETEAEFERMMQAMDYGEVDCIRVHGCRPQWAERLRAAGHGHQIDPPEGPMKRRADRALVDGAAGMAQKSADFLDEERGGGG